MLAVNTSPYNFVNLFDTLQGLQQIQQHQRKLQQQYQSTRPKIVKKVETEDAFQIQIFKQSGNFDLYEVKVLRTQYPYPSNLVNLVLQSPEDEFKKVFQFSLDDIEVQSIDWEYYKDQNVLVLNVPKKARYCSDDYAKSVLASLFGIPAACGQADYGKKQLKHEKRYQRREERALRRQEDEEIATARRIEVQKKKSQNDARRAAEANREAAKREAERKEALKLAEAVRIAEERIKAKEAEASEAARRAQEAREEAERLAALRLSEVERLAEEFRRAKEAEKAARARNEKRISEERVAKAKRVAEEKSAKEKKIAEEKIAKEKKIAEEKARRVEEVKEKKRKDAEKAAEEQHDRSIAALREALRLLFGSSSGSPSKESTRAGNTEKTSTPSSPLPSKYNIPSSPDHDTAMSDTESIGSDVDTPSESSKSDIDTSDSLHRHASLEEVEDEEFVMFRKKVCEK